MNTGLEHTSTRAQRRGKVRVGWRCERVGWEGGGWGGGVKGWGGGVRGWGGRVGV